MERAGANVFSLQVFWTTQESNDLSFVTTGGSEKTSLNQISGLLIPSSAEQSYQTFPSTPSTTTCFPSIVLEALMVIADARARQTTSRTRTTHAYVWKLLAISADSVLSVLSKLPLLLPLEMPRRDVKQLRFFETVFCRNLVKMVEASAQQVQGGHKAMLCAACSLRPSRHARGVGRAVWMAVLVLSLPCIAGAASMLTKTRYDLNDRLSARLVSSLPKLVHLRGGGATSVEVEEDFKNLMAMSGCKSILRLREGQRGRGLFTAGAVAEGDELLTVPLSACLVEPREISDEEAEQLLGRPLSQGTCYKNTALAGRRCEFASGANPPKRAVLVLTAGSKQ